MRLRWVLLAAILASAAFPAAASAVITASNIDTPASGRIMLGNGSTTKVHGTTTGTGNVDLMCRFSPYSEDDRLLLSNVTVVNNVFTVYLPQSSFRTGTCSMHAVPAGAPTPGDLSPFTGPVITSDFNAQYWVAGGPNGGTLQDYYLAEQGPQAYNDLDSVDSCGLCDTRLLTNAAAGYNSNFLWFGNAAMYDAGTQGMNFFNYITIDGHNALFASGRNDANYLASPFPAATFSIAVDPATRDVTITEDQDATRCPDDTLPPTAARCPSFIMLGVHLHRVIHITTGGTVTNVVDTFSSTDGAAHALSLAYDQYQDEGGHGAGTYQPSYQFPWAGAAFAIHDYPDTIGPAPSAPATIYVRDNSTAADGDTYYPQGSITASPAPTGATFHRTNDFTLNFAPIVPAGGSSTIQQTFTIANTQAAVAALASAAEDAQSPPSVAISSPANGATVASSPVTVSGTATDNKGVTSLTVNGIAVAPGAGGGFSVPVALNPGANTITATASDAAGNRTSASVAVTYTPPPPVKPVVVTPAFTILSSRVSKTGVITEKVRTTPGVLKALARLQSAIAAAKKKRTTTTYGTAQVTARSAGTVTITIKPSSAAKRALNARRTLKVKVTITLSPSGGGKAVSHTTKTLTVKLPRKKR